MLTLERLPRLAMPTPAHLIDYDHVSHLIPAAAEPCFSRPQPQVMRLVLLSSSEDLRTGGANQCTSYFTTTGGVRCAAALVSGHE